MSSHNIDHEKRLVELCLKGDGQAWQELAETHKGMLLKVIRLRQWGFDSHEVDDMLQEVLEQLVVSLKRFNFDCRLSTFIYRIALNVCVGEYRKQTALKRDRNQDMVTVDTTDVTDTEEQRIVVENPHPMAEDHLLFKEKADLAIRALKSLSRACRELIRLRYVEDHSFKDISAKFNEEPNTLVKRMSRCLKKAGSFIRAEGYS